MATVITVGEKDIRAVREALAANPTLAPVIKDLAEVEKANYRNDLERRRVSIRLKQGVALTKAQITDAYRTLFVATGLGKLDETWGRGRNATFYWPKEYAYKELCSAVLGTASSGKRLAASGQSRAALTVTINLSTGRQLQLSVDEARELRDELARL